MNVLVDINVLLDVFLNRTTWLADSAAVVQANHDGRITIHVSAVTLPTIFYIVRRQAGIPQAQMVVDECLALKPLSMRTSPATRAGFSGAPILVLTPADLLARLAGGTP